MRQALILLYLLTGCATEPVVLPVRDSLEVSASIDIEIPDTKYKVGECFSVFDPESGKGDKRDILIIDDITQTKYIYRWWIYWTNSWARETNSGIGEFSLFERMTKEAECPNS